MHNIDYYIDYSTPKVMGVLNITPDSFSDGGNFLSADKAFLQAKSLYEEGAEIIDVGGESTRPGAAIVPLAQELDRVIPVIEQISRELPVLISIDTSKAEVMRLAVAAGAGMINDVFALRAERALETAASLQVPVCLMHMQGTPHTMQKHPLYNNVLQEVKEFLLDRISACIQAGIPRTDLLVDPGFGFGKTLEHNAMLFKHLQDLQEMLDLPLLIGVSRKSMLGEITGRATGQRVYAGVALAALAVSRKASIIRSHDVAATVDAVRVAQAMSEL